MKEIEVFADVCCPFTHVGLRHFVRRRYDEGRDDLVLRVRAWPLELVNGKPLEATRVAEQVDALRSQVAPNLFGGFDRTRFPGSSLPALALTAHAYRVGPIVGERVSLALRDALFEHGRDIGDGLVLDEVASLGGVVGADLDVRLPVLADWREGRERGVVGSPHFFVGGRGFFCPTLDIEKVDGHLRVRRDAEALVTFLDECFR